MPRVALTAVMGLLLVGTASNAYAQDDTAAERADARLARLEKAPELRIRPGLACEGQLPPPFTFTLTVPITYNTNIDNSETDRRRDFHTNPSGQFDYMQQSGTIRPFVRLIADADEYFEHEENGASTIIGRIGVRLVDPKLGAFVPYVHYTQALVFGRHFDDHQLTLHTFVAGIGGKVPLGNVVMRPDFQIARREATNALAERHQAGATVTFLGDLVPDKVSWSLAQAVQLRHYTGGANEGRDDLNFTTSAGLSVAVSELISLELNASFEHNNSDRTAKDYSVFDFGPSIVLSVPFGSSEAASGSGGSP
jgi:hypothetical protein